MYDYFNTLVSNLPDSTASSPSTDTIEGEHKTPEGSADGPTHNNPQISWEKAATMIEVYRKMQSSTPEVITVSFEIGDELNERLLEEAGHILLFVQQNWDIEIIPRNKTGAGILSGDAEENALIEIILDILRSGVQTGLALGAREIQPVITLAERRLEKAFIHSQSPYQTIKLNYPGCAVSDLPSPDESVAKNISEKWLIKGEPKDYASFKERVDKNQDIGSPVAPFGGSRAHIQVGAGAPGFAEQMSASGVYHAAISPFLTFVFGIFRQGVSVALFEVYERNKVMLEELGSDVV